LKLKLFPYEIIVNSNTSGLIEFLHNTVTVDKIKKECCKNLNEFYNH